MLCSKLVSNEYVFEVLLNICIFIMSFYAFMEERFNYKDFAILGSIALVLYHLKAKPFLKRNLFHCPGCILHTSLLFTDPQVHANFHD